MASLRAAVVLLFAVLPGACISPTPSVDEDAGVAELRDGGQSNDAGTGEDAGPRSDAGQPDGTATTQTCTNTFGTQLTAVHGRLDGLLVAVVPPGGLSPARRC